VLHDEDFDFNYQKSYRKNAVLMPGDTITTECTYSQPMSFGESTKSEMCYLFTMAYPKGALASPDIWGTFAHGGSSCLGQ
jgi:Copper type II ascorbate-dependent monooxygenase, C-terminal domain